MPPPVDPPHAAETAHAPAITRAVISWFDDHARDLPWRRSECTPWGILVSEFMLQQTPVQRVLEPWGRWLERWPTPGALAADSPGEAVREWGRLGYPRRALRLHSTATVIERDHDGVVPNELADLLALPGVGNYTAAAVASFAYGHSHLVLDTNVRRVLARAFSGVEFPSRSPTVAERTLAAEVLPAERAATWAAGSMELGAVVCTASRPRCASCPISAWCAWRAAGQPAHAGPPRRGQTYAGTDRQVRGLLLRMLREAERPVPKQHLAPTWPEPIQRERALNSLVHDGLAVCTSMGYALPN